MQIFIKEFLEMCEHTHLDETELYFEMKKALKNGQDLTKSDAKRMIHLLDSVHAYETPIFEKLNEFIAEYEE